MQEMWTAARILRQCPPLEICSTWVQLLDIISSRVSVRQVSAVALRSGFFEGPEWKQGA
jgi:hypothetical protein